VLNFKARDVIVKGDTAYRMRRETIVIASGAWLPRREGTTARNDGAAILIDTARRRVCVLFERI